jgi:hypothetical protein
MQDSSVGKPAEQHWAVQYIEREHPVLVLDTEEREAIVIAQVCCSYSTQRSEPGGNVRGLLYDTGTP